ncbi:MULTISPECIES: riboflavin synthase [Macrococcus]|uniref:Riboflavin synthase n=1 Tax=Macrococcus psychrotolerans TaxID=3039389 RepID=A0AAU6RKB4_9STAP|nr:MULTISPECIES: riboflavin synthase [Macrococcus]MDJ1111612.1 riboflavin synthase [Macrococcus sp. S115]QYA32343.1 riboflavin synthase [Macrococcus sp. 19Msa1099]QYA37150.1 riboflavin synthase [Macrococcus caseolyticus]QYA75858.1 riboflavin synthase [Macrococcus caseolyticus]
MFTGIVEEVGTISQIKQQSDTTVMMINCQEILSDIHIGDSISVNGVCLTVTSFNAQSFTVDIVRGTSAITLFHTMKAGTQVNLERALLPTTRLGGHFVSGHIDTSVSVKRIQHNEKTYIIELELPPQFKNNVIPKGSIAVNGVSLTIFELTNSITLNIIPETVRSTMLNTLKTGDKVHIEFDMLGKYILNQTKSSDTLTLSKLEMMM